MIYIIRKKINYQDFGNKRINTGLNYVEEKNIDTPKEYVLFGTECCKKFLEEDVEKNNQKVDDILELLNQINSYFADGSSVHIEA